MTDIVKRALDAAFAAGEAQADGVRGLELASLVAEMDEAEAALRATNAGGAPTPATRQDDFEEQDARYLDRLAGEIDTSESTLHWRQDVAFLQSIAAKIRRSPTLRAPEVPDDIADVVRSAFVAGMDKCREVRDAYGEWPSLPGRIELGQDYVDGLTLLGPEESTETTGLRDGGDRAATD